MAKLLDYQQRREQAAGAGAAAAATATWPLIVGRRVAPLGRNIN